MQVQDDMGGRELIETSTEEDTVVMEEGEKESSLRGCSGAEVKDRDED